MYILKPIIPVLEEHTPSELEFKPLSLLGLLAKIKVII